MVVPVMPANNQKIYYDLENSCIGRGLVSGYRYVSHQLNVLAAGYIVVLRWFKFIFPGQYLYDADRLCRFIDGVRFSD